MTAIAHLSDLHFGHEDPLATGALLADLRARRPAVVVVSGDLTQRAQEDEFRAAGAFLAALPAPWLAVPGNHDVPLYEVRMRFGDPWKRWRAHVATDLEPLLVRGGLAVLGLNTARALALKGGRISREQMSLVRERLGALPEGLLKVVVTHHQFLPPPGGRAALVGRAAEALAALEEAGVDLLLAGHLHVGYSGDVRDAHPRVRRSMLAVQAGTAISTRGRGEPNAYNWIVASPGRVDLEVRSWSGSAFVAAASQRYVRAGGAWRREIA